MKSLLSWIKAKALAAWGWLKGWKTVLFGALLVIGPDALDILSQISAIDFSSFLPDSLAHRVTSIIGALVIVLRLVTSTPVFKKDA